MTAPRTSGPRSSAARRPLLNVLSNWLGFGITSLVSFFLSPYVVHHLGTAAYGTWLLIGSLTGYMGLLDLGVRGAVTRFVANFHAQGKHRDASAVVSSGVVIFLALGVAAVLVSVVLATYALDAFHIATEYRTVAQTVLVLSGFTVATSLMGGVFGGVLTGMQRFQFTNAFEIAVAIIRAIVTVSVLSAGHGLVALALVNLASSVLTLTVYAIASVRAYPDLEVRMGRSDTHHVKLIISFSLYSFMLHVSAFVMFYTDSLVIGASLPVSMVAFFGIAGTLVSYSRTLTSGISTIVTPLVSARQVDASPEQLQAIVMKGVRMASLVVFPIGVTFIIRGATFISLWMGPTYGELSGRILAILTISLMISAANQVVSAAVSGLNKHRLLVPVVVMEAVANLVMSIVLVRWMGVAGVAWGTTIPSVLASVFAWPVFVTRLFGISRREFMTWAWLRPALAVLPFAACTLAMERFWAASQVFEFFLQVLVCLPVCGAGAWLLVLIPEERDRVIATLRTQWHRLAPARG